MPGNKVNRYPHCCSSSSFELWHFRILGSSENLRQVLDPLPPWVHNHIILYILSGFHGPRLNTCSGSFLQSLNPYKKWIFILHWMHERPLVEARHLRETQWTRSLPPAVYSQWWLVNHKSESVLLERSFSESLVICLHLVFFFPSLSWDLLALVCRDIYPVYLLMFSSCWFWILGFHIFCILNSPNLLCN